MRICTDDQALARTPHFFTKTGVSHLPDATIGCERDAMKNKNDLGHLDPAWEGFVIQDAILFTPNGYRYPPGFIYSIPTTV